MTQVEFEIHREWVQLQFEEWSPIQDVYGFSSTKGVITVEGVRYVPEGMPSKTLLVFMHPAATQTILAVPRAMARYGLHVLVAGSRFTRNDTSLIMEKVLRDLGAYVRHAKEVWGYERVVLAGWSGGGSLAIFYQSQAEQPSITETPAGDPIDVRSFGLIAADGVIFHAAHNSRASLLLDFLDPSVLDESNPDVRELELDLYDARNPNRPPYHAEFIARFRAAQKARMSRRTAWVKSLLADLRGRGTCETERAFVTHRTLADPRFLDATLDPSDREVGTSFLGEPALANVAPAGLARISTLRSWLSQWSAEDSHVDAVKNVREVTVPLLAIVNTADNAVLGSQVERVFEAAGSKDKKFISMVGANHYYSGQPDHLLAVCEHYRTWMSTMKLLGD
jgi:pimeloyl-ACP methyl ester carboxylesterase